MDVSFLRKLLRNSPGEHQITFFRRQIDFLLGRSSAFKSRARALPTQFIMDNSAVIAKVSSSLAGYARVALTLGYSEDAVSHTVQQFVGTTTLLSFDHFLDMLAAYEPPRQAARTLCQGDFQNTDSTFPSGGADRVFQPSELQAKVINHVFAETSRLGMAQIKGIIVMATGLGKSFLSAFLIDRQIMAAGGYSQFIEDPRQCVLFVVNSTFIRNQTCEKYERYFTPLLQATGHASSTQPKRWFLNIDTDSREGLALVSSQNALGVKFVFCLFQSIHLLPDRLRARVSHVVVDEAHHVAAPSYMSVVERLAEAHNTRLMIGLTATLYHRADTNAARIKKVFGGSVFADLPWTVAKDLGLFPGLRYFEYRWDGGSASRFREAEGLRYSALKRALEAGVLSMQQFFILLSRSVRGVPRSCLGEDDAAAGQPAAPDEFLSTVAGKLAEFLSSFPLADLRRPKRVMAFFSSVRQIEGFAEVFRPYAEKAHARIYSAHYKVNHKRLSSLFAEFSALPRQTEQTLIMCTVSMATEGFDLPYVDCVAFMRRTESERVYVQQLGRCLRLHASKPLSYALDFVYSLRLRWIRLRDELLDSTLLSYIKSFWDVEELGGAGQVPATVGLDGRRKLDAGADPSAPLDAASESLTMLSGFSELGAWSSLSELSQQSDEEICPPVAPPADLSESSAIISLDSH